MARARTILGVTLAATGVVALAARRSRPVAVTRSPSPVAPSDPAPTSASVTPDRLAPVRSTRARLTPARARAVVRAASWSETLLGLLAVIITLLLGADADEEAQPSIGASDHRPRPDALAS